MTRAAAGTSGTTGARAPRRPRRVRVATAGVVVALTALAAACGRGGDGPTPPAVAPVASVRFGVAVDTLEPGGTRAPVARALDAQGAVLAGRAVAYAVDPQAVATVDGAGTVTAVAPGAATLTATSEGRTATVALAVVRVPVAAVAFPAGVAAGVTLREGETQAVAATATDAKQRVRADRPVAYTTADAAIATVDANGVVTARGAGQTTLTATAEERSASLAVTVRAVRAALYPTSLVAAPNATGTLWATLRDDAGARVRATAVTYESSDPSVVAVDAVGTYRAVGAGTATLRATVNGKVAASAVTVRAAGAALYPISLVFVGEVPADVRAAAEAAARRWERVIAQAAPVARVDLPQNGCYVGMAPYAADVPGLRVFVVADSLNSPAANGGTVALAGACVLRDAANGDMSYGLPALGVIRYDTTLHKRQVAHFGADAPQMVANVYLHEMAHVLGFPALGNFPFHPTRPRQFVQGAGTGDVRWVAGEAKAAAAALGLVAAGADVPFESLGGSGTVGSHWRQATFGRELLTGFVQAGPMPLSAVTVRALADLGFAVDETAADLVTAADLNAQAFGPRDPTAALAGALAAPFTAGGPAAGRPAVLGAGARSMPLGGDDVIAPRWVVRRDGTLRGWGAR